MASFTLTFNATQGPTLNISGFTFTVTSTDTIYTCDDPTASNILNSDFSSTYSSTLISVENIPANVTIGNSAFMLCLALTSVTLESGLTTIGDYAFTGTGIASITIPASVTSFGSFAFDSCPNLTSVTFESGSTLTTIGDSAFRLTGISSITIPASVTSIGSDAFNNCTNLTSVTFESGSTLTTIGDSAFSVTGISSITIPATVTSIGSFAFNSCTNLTNITIPGSVTSIGITAFASCNALTSIDVDENNTVYSNYNNDGVLYNKSRTTLLQYPIGNPETSFVIPGSVTSIGNSAFRNCLSLNSVTLESGLTTIGNSAFRSSGLISVSIPATVTSFGEDAFADCSALTSVTLESGLTTIGDDAFQQTGITSITIPASVTSFGSYAFGDCSALTSVTLESGLIIIGDTAFINTGISSITIPASVTDFGSYAFAECSALISVTLESGLTIIGSFAFATCPNLTSIRIPSSVTTFGDDAFTGIPTNPPSSNPATLYYGSQGVYDQFFTTYGFGNTINYINDEPTTPFTLTFNATQGSQLTISGFAFTVTSTDTIYTCDDPTASNILNNDFSSTYSSTLISVENIPANVTNIDDGAFGNCFRLTSVTFDSGSTLTTIGGYAFQRSGITSITIPASVNNIGITVFSSCEFLTSIDVDENNTVYSNYNNDGVLYNKSRTTLLEYPTGKTATSFVIPGSVTTISAYAFYTSTSVFSILIPSSVTIIENDVFSYSTSLTSILVDENNTVYSNYNNDGVLYNKSRTTLLQYPIGNPETSFVIPGSVTSIGNSAFSTCNALTSVTLQSGLTTIGISAFNLCTNLTSITIPASVTNFGFDAFRGCTKLISITIPASVTIIGDFAFTGIPTYPPQLTLQDAATLYTSPLNESTNSVYAYFKTNFIDGVNQINYINDGPIPPPIPPPIPMVCFKEDSKILTKQGYRPIQDLRKGDLIKTIKNGYIPIDMIGYREIYNPICEERIKDKLYVCTNKEYSEIFEDLVITGCHSILIEKYLTQEQLDKSAQVNGGIFATDDKYRLPACVDERAKPYEKEGNYTIYHLALENDDYFMNYGIYANGLIVETCSKRYLKELSNMTLQL